MMLSAVAFVRDRRLGLVATCFAADNETMRQPSLFWVILDDAGEREELVPLEQPAPGQEISLVSGTRCVIDRVDPPPQGGHIAQGIIHAHTA